MKKGIMLLLILLPLLFIFLVIMLWQSGSRRNELQDGISDTFEWNDTQAAVTGINTVLEENTQYLDKYIKASWNKTNSLLGMEEAFAKLRNCAEDAKEATKECTNRLNESEESAYQEELQSLDQLYDDIVKINEQFEEKNDKMKKAKKTFDVETIENTLEELSDVIDEYVFILNNFTEVTGYAQNSHC